MNTIIDFNENNKNQNTNNHYNLYEKSNLKNDKDHYNNFECGDSSPTGSRLRVKIIEEYIYNSDAFTFQIEKKYEEKYEKYINNDKIDSLDR